MRIALGGIVLLEVAQRGLHYAEWQEQIARLGIGNPHMDAPLLRS